jgi:Cu-Zn family superoxide dismutase
MLLSPSFKNYPVTLKPKLFLEHELNQIVAQSFLLKSFGVFFGDIFMQLLLRVLIGLCILVPAFYTEVRPVSANTQKKIFKANIKPVENNKVSGLITFEDAKDGVIVKGNIKNLTPGKHGIHIHEIGNCSGPGAKTAGEHFNPTMSPHGDRSENERHAGDFGNIDADKDGVAKFEFLDKKAQLKGANSIIGKSLIIHAKEDDTKTQPSGNSGDRVACGIIE